jgi:hypothetical protein
MARPPRDRIEFSAGEAPSEVDSHIGPTGGDAKNLCMERLRRSPSGSGHKPLGELVDPGSNSRCSGRPSSLEWSASCAGGIRTHEGPNGPQRFSRPSRFGATASAQRVARFEVHVWELRTYAPSTSLASTSRPRTRTRPKTSGTGADSDYSGLQGRHGRAPPCGPGVCTPFCD